MVVGDFNEIAYAFEKKEGRVRWERQMEDFFSALANCELHDLGFSGKWFTWEQGQFLVLIYESDLIAVLLLLQGRIIFLLFGFYMPLIRYLIIVHLLPSVCVV
ncbi:hypothetical protein ES332_D02G155400v1 [Gossypium tomentosum]|uniref:Endonuclease/exonuclease/phosphatase domain-containing protein n=1 Tax=Gossypium tomentosum TaxID=34277 RepID=A0A5D2LXM0_GOSTO|nr:hypothetical protein ES332_D02G155400v1 [Gossypium tomentosum]